MILLVVSYESKNIIFYEKNLKLTKSNIMFFVIEFFLTIVTYYFFLIIGFS